MWGSNRLVYLNYKWPFHCSKMVNASFWLLTCIHKFMVLVLNSASAATRVSRLHPVFVSLVYGVVQTIDWISHLSQVKPLILWNLDVGLPYDFCQPEDVGNVFSEKCNEKKKTWVRAKKDKFLHHYWKQSLTDARAKFWVCKMKVVESCPIWKWNLCIQYDLKRDFFFKRNVRLQFREEHSTNIQKS